MTEILDTGISIVSHTNTDVQLNLGVDIYFTSDDLHQGQTGAAKYQIDCNLWDDDPGSNDDIAFKSVLMEPGSIQEVTGVNILFDLSLAELRKREPFYESTIEIFGRFRLWKDKAQLGYDVDGRNITIVLPQVIYE